MFTSVIKSLLLATTLMTFTYSSAKAADAITIDDSDPVPPTETSVQLCNPDGGTRFWLIPNTNTCIDLYGRVSGTGGYISYETPTSLTEKGLALYNGMIGFNTVSTSPENGMSIRTSLRLAIDGLANLDEYNIYFERAMMYLGAKGVSGMLNVGYDESPWSKFTNGGIGGINLDRLGSSAIVDGYYGYNRTLQANYIHSIGLDRDSVVYLLGGVDIQADQYADVYPAPMAGLAFKYMEIFKASGIIVGDFVNETMAAKVAASYLIEDYNLTLGGWYSAQFGDNSSVSSEYVDGENAYGVYAKYAPLIDLSLYGGWSDSANSEALLTFGAIWEPIQYNFEIQPEITLPVENGYSGWLASVRMTARW
jgi:hypothetical protein